MSNSPACFLTSQCPVFSAGCVFCFSRWLEILPLLRNETPVENTLDSVSPPEVSSACMHRGSKRRCCEALWICRKHSCDCTVKNLGDFHPDVRSCADCADFQIEE